MVHFETIKEKAISSSDGRFLELSRKCAKDSKGEEFEFTSLTLGEHWSNGEGKAGKRFKKSFTIPKAFDLEAVGKMFLDFIKE